MVPSLLSADSHALVLGVILVGGASRRYGHDKAMARLGGTPLVQWVAKRVAGQVSILAASGTDRPGLNIPIIRDDISHGGPLCALQSILAWADERGIALVATFSCDTPFLPSELVARLRYALDADCDCAVALHSGAAHPTCALWKTAALPKIQAAFKSGVHCLHGALTHLKVCTADFPEMGDGPGGDPFFNINSQAEMAVAQAWFDQSRVAPSTENAARLVVSP